jgi:Flp pilus assembly protein TadB
MWTSFLVAMGGVMAIGLVMAAVAWLATDAVNAAARRRSSDSAELERSLDRIERELKRVRGLAISKI